MGVFDDRVWVTDIHRLQDTDERGRYGHVWLDSVCLIDLLRGWQFRSHLVDQLRLCYVTGAVRVWRGYLQLWRRRCDVPGP